MAVLEDAVDVEVDLAGRTRQAGKRNIFFARVTNENIWRFPRFLSLEE